MQRGTDPTVRTPRPRLNIAIPSPRPRIVRRNRFAIRFAHRLAESPAADEGNKMFFHIVLERNMQLHPRHFGPHLRDKLVSKLIKDVEGTCSGRHGFVVAITGVEDIGKGLIREGTGYVTFPVKYQCVVFRPFKGEILEAVVTMVNKMGFFAEAGPVQIFVSNHLIPDDMEFQSGDVPNYTTSDGSVKIQKDSEVRLKIIGTRVDATEIFCIGTIKDDFLGVISDPGAAV
ncbi:DNA-directed RNA polymerase II subunit RPB7 [Oryza brachyantha]|uniref:DNA-directed RNA polymerase subunit n=2 Tax=Oryza TaxID=4527 RepID=J3M6Z1_ORYBR|nr:DNA-directed RNA polymerase II subunit RPB7 [Oryza brachyantha]